MDDFIYHGGQESKSATQKQAKKIEKSVFHKEKTTTAQQPKPISIKKKVAPLTGVLILETAVALIARPLIFNK